ncbi:hypothetical protein N7541_011537 [Penicillium brevicompactum]|uniref:SWIM-type domain-containing protein n=1 Tax=Penicillium brevicompactum TaxID=5074 RepID=A0A9W9QWK8_PENBR|nr:hypothetical protein N7541_011537 [Penicillium brevicompactum]
MTAPTRQFHRLSIGRNMPDQTALPTHAGRPDPSDDSDPDQSDSSVESSGGEGEGDEDEEESESTSTSILAPSGITYDLSHLDSESEARALVGLTGSFDVINCRNTSAGYDFQLLDRPRVHLGSDPSTCTCSVFQSHPDVACQHIFWLVDQLHGCFVRERQTREVALAPDGRPADLPRLEGLLEGNLEAVATQLRWQYLQEESDGSGRGMTRTEKVRDIFSAFSKQTLPEEFRQDLNETTEQARTAEQCVVQGDFDATIFRLAVHDDAVFESLKKVMPPGACAAIYFDKMQARSRRLLSDFDQYCSTETPHTDPTSQDGYMDVNEVALQLQRSVSRIAENIALRSPHGTEGAGETLVSLLEWVVARNNDPLEHNRFRDSFNGEDEDQRNLYHLLIGSIETDSETDARHFVLHALNALPPLDLYQFDQRLHDILRKLEVNRAPKQYLINLANLIRSANSAAAMGSGQKRPAAGNGNSGGYSKRTR